MVTDSDRACSLLQTETEITVERVNKQCECAVRDEILCSDHRRRSKRFQISQIHIHIRCDIFNFQADIKWKSQWLLII
jgi:hypothetical protein